jgi:hypothetical protein
VVCHQKLFFLWCLFWWLFWHGSFSGARVRKSHALIQRVSTAAATKQMAWTKTNRPQPALYCRRRIQFLYDPRQRTLGAAGGSAPRVHPVITCTKKQISDISLSVYTRFFWGFIAFWGVSQRAARGAQGHHPQRFFLACRKGSTQGSRSKTECPVPLLSPLHSFESMHLVLFVRFGDHMHTAHESRGAASPSLYSRLAFGGLCLYWTVRRGLVAGLPCTSPHLIHQQRLVHLKCCSSSDPQRASPSASRARPPPNQAAQAVAERDTLDHLLAGSAQGANRGQYLIFRATVCGPWLMPWLMSWLLSVHPPTRPSSHSRIASPFITFPIAQSPVRGFLPPFSAQTALPS